MKKFEMMDPGSIALYLDMKFTRLNNGIFLTQKAYLLQILYEFDMMDCKLASMLMAEGLKLGTEDDSPGVDPKQF